MQKREGRYIQPSVQLPFGEGAGPTPVPSAGSGQGLQAPQALEDLARWLCLGDMKPTARWSGLSVSDKTIWMFCHLIPERTKQAKVYCFWKSQLPSPCAHPVFSYNLSLKYHLPHALPSSAAAMSGKNVIYLRGLCTVDRL